MDENVKKSPQKARPKKNNRPKAKKLSSNLKLMALGGLGEVGKNCYIIEYKREIYVIDYGVLFPDKDQLGVDYIIPNYSYLKENQDRIKGVFITHGHEDHIGGIPFLLKTLKVPAIYATQTAKLMIEKKFKEHKLTQKLVEINDQSVLKFGDVTIETFRQTHSIPDAVGLFIGTPEGNIVSTGDFKVDFSPPGQLGPDFHKMTYLSQRGVLCLISDSTNAHTPGFSLSESSVGTNLKTLIREADGRILFTTFASNINRVQQIIEGALENNRKVCILGRSLVNALQIGTKTGYIKIKPRDLIEPKQIKNYEPHEVVIISTGSQGEALAALSRIANGLNQNIVLDNTDTIVFASNPIPGNNYPIGKVIDALAKTECKIIRNTDVFKTHASGHASQEEQKLLLSLWRPKFFAPVHGTYNMLKAHKENAMMIGIPEENIFLLDNGDILHLNDTKPVIERKVVPGNSIYISGNNINVSLTDGTMDKLASDGILIFTAIYDDSRNLISYPQIITRGFVVINESLDLLRDIQSVFLEQYHQNKRLEMSELQLLLADNMSQYIHEKTDKLPLITCNLIKFDPDNFENQDDKPQKRENVKKEAINKPKAIKRNHHKKKNQNKAKAKAPNKAPKQKQVQKPSQNKAKAKAPNKAPKQA